MTTPSGDTYNSAKAYLQNLFSTYLDVDPLVADWAYKRLQDDAMTADEVMRELRYGADSSPSGQAAHAAYITRYPDMKKLLQQGKLPWSPGSSPEQTYQEYENTIRSLVQRYGISPTFAMRENVSKYLMNDVSASEAADRMKLASDAVDRMPPETRGLFKSYYGLDEKDLTSYFLDPAEQAPLLERKSTAVRLAGEGLSRGVQINAAKADWLAMQEISPSQAAEAFTAVSARFGLEQSQSGESIGRDRVVDAAFGNEQAMRDVTRVQDARKATFKSASGTSASTKGVTALGSSND